MTLLPIILIIFFIIFIIITSLSNIAVVNAAEFKILPGAAGVTGVTAVYYDIDSDSLLFTSTNTDMIYQYNLSPTGGAGGVIVGDGSTSMVRGDTLPIPGIEFAIDTPNAAPDMLPYNDETTNPKFWAVSSFKSHVIVSIERKAPHFSRVISGVIGENEFGINPAKYSFPQGVAHLKTQRQLVICDSNNEKIRVLSLFKKNSSSNVFTLSGSKSTTSSGSGLDGSAATATFRPLFLLYHFMLILYYSSPMEREVNLE
jgi:hypothetical protein